MSNVKWYKHKIFCSDENQWVFKITENMDQITTCPNNPVGHSCVAGSGTIITYISNNLVKIQEESANADTGGFYSMKGRALTVQPHTSKFDAFLPKIPCSILRGHFRSRPELEGDSITAYVLPQSSQVVGYITSDILDGDTVIHVSFSVLMMIEIQKLARVYFSESTGRETVKYTITSMDFASGTITLEEELNTEDGEPLRAQYGVYVHLDTNIVGVMTTPNTIHRTWINIATPAMHEIKRGRYLNLFCHNQLLSQQRMIEIVDTVNSRVKISQPFDVALTPSGEMPVYIQLNIRTVNEVELDANSIIDVGAGTIGGSYIGLDVVLCLVYTRNGDTPVRIRYQYEMLY
jgi:hypothetical protein